MVNKVLTIGFVALLLSGLFVAATVEAPSRKDTSLRANLFRVEIGGTMVPAIMAVRGLTCTTELITVRQGDDTIRLPGSTACGPIVLQYRAGESPQLYAWYDNVRRGNPDARDGSIILVDKTGSELTRYNFFQAFPVRWSVSDLDARADVHLVEELELAVERVEKQ